MSPDPQDSPESDDFDRVVAALNKHRVDFMIIGGWAVVYHGHVRLTEDLGIYIRPTEENAKRAVAAVEAVGGACPELRPEVFTRDNGISLGDKPVRIDIISKLPGVDFAQAWGRVARKPAPSAARRSTLFRKRTSSTTSGPSRGQRTWKTPVNFKPPKIGSSAAPPTTRRRSGTLRSQ